MIDDNMPCLIRYKIMQEVIITATKLDRLAIITIKGKESIRYENFGLSLPKFIFHMRTWGQASFIKTRPTTVPKLTNKGSSCMFVRCAEDYAGDFYQMWEPEKNYVFVTRDLLWLKRMHFNKTNLFIT